MARPKGGISDYSDPKKGLGVHNTLAGGRQVSVQRPDGSKIYGERGRPGYVQHGFKDRNGRDYTQRTYSYRGRTYTRVYRSYTYHGVAIAVYAPVRYYPVYYYGWAYNPWTVPVVYGWGWGPAPWVSFYGGYFAPYPVYPSAAFWLTDYMVSNDLQAQYQANQDAQLAAQPVQAGQPVLTPEIKDQIAAEVKNQLALESDEAQQNSAGQGGDPSASSVANMLNDKQAHVFVVAGPMDMVDASGEECALSAGDVLSLGANSQIPADAQAADLVVLASKGGQECQKAGTVTVQISDLQEMQNHMRETIDQGLGEMQAKAGKGGMPALPASAQGQPTMTEVAQNAPPPDPTAAAQISQQMQEADSAVGDATGQARQAGMDIAPPPPATVTAGQTIDQVQAALGQPSQVVDLGAKKVYVYNNMKITFLNGKVKDVQ